jgi:protein phosphatase
MRLEIHAATDVGRRRTQNEDSHVVWVPEDPVVRERLGVLMVVADGMGGALAGEVASRIAAETVRRMWEDSPGPADAAALGRAIEEANHLIHHQSESRPDHRGMGTTCTAVAVVRRRVLIAHVGDSRVYLVHGGAGRTLTRDHSLVAQLLADGHLTEEQARVDPRRNVVSRSVGVSENVDVDVVEVAEPLADGDILVLSSDGLHGLVSDEEIAAAATGHGPAEAGRALIALANARGGPDNITVVIARAVAGDGADPAGASPAPTG